MGENYSVASGRAANATDVAFRKQREALAGAQLTNVRAVSSNWRNGVGLGTLASTLVGLATTPDIIKTASNQQVANGAWLLGIGALAGLMSIGCAMRASFGWPTQAALSSPDDFQAWETKEVGRTICYLRSSMYLAVVGFLALCAGYAVLIFHVPLPAQFPDWQR